MPLLCRSRGRRLTIFDPLVLGADPDPLVATYSPCPFECGTTRDRVLSQLLSTSPCSHLPPPPATRSAAADSAAVPVFSISCLLRSDPRGIRIAPLLPWLPSQLLDATGCTYRYSNNNFPRRCRTTDVLRLRQTSKVVGSGSWIQHRRGLFRSCVTSNAGPHGATQNYTRDEEDPSSRQSGVESQATASSVVKAMVGACGNRERSQHGERGERSDRDECRKRIRPMSKRGCPSPGSARGCPDTARAHPHVGGAKLNQALYGT